MNNKNLNEITNCYSGQPTHVILNLIQDLNRDAECPQHDNRGQQSGRSMVEMLGVLAVIGVLTVIGFAGFKIAMNKAKANNLVADMNRLAHIVVMDKFSGYSEEGINRDVAEHNQKTEYPASCNSTFKSAMFSLTLQNPIDKEMCEQLANLDWQVPQGVFLNEVEKETLQAEDCIDSNKLTWVFMDDLSHCSDCILSEFKCGGYGNECGSCSDLRGYTRDDSKCGGSTPYCILGNCAPCEPGQTVYNNNCQACSGINNTIMTVDDCHKCIDAENKPTHFMRNTRCFRCSDTDTSFWETSTLAECTRCPNRCFREDINHCGIPGMLVWTGSKHVNFVGYERDNATGLCVKTSCPDGQTFLNNNCTACTSINDTAMSLDDCHKCVDAQGKHTHFMRNTRCFNCLDADKSMWDISSLEACNLCENRCFRQDTNKCGIPGQVSNGNSFVGYERDNATGLCVKTSCPDGQTFNLKNNCTACTSINDTAISLDDCHKCVDAQGKHTHFMRNTRCFNCLDADKSMWDISSLEACNLCENRCLASNGVCYVYGPGQTYTGKDDAGHCTQ